MCSVVGWFGDVDVFEKRHILDKASERGRDGYGFYVDGKEIRSTSETIEEKHEYKILNGNNVLGNFRATPTTEAESTEDNIQPYDGIVHNGTIANDKEFGDFPIDSMILPKVVRGGDLHNDLAKLKGSFAIAFYENDKLMLARNYKPIYYRRTNNAFQFASTPNMIKYESTPMEPYSVMEVDKYLQKSVSHIKRKQNKKVIVSASSGLDSTTVAYMLKDKYEVTLAYFTYDCLAEEKELSRIRKIADVGGFDLVTIDMPKIMDGTIVNGEYHKDKIAGTEYAMDWVSARNLLMLSMLTAYAESNDFGFIAFGGNLEESGAYPDNEQEFGRKFNELLPYAVQNGVKIELLQPVSTLMKHEIVKEGVKHNVPFEITWSCYGDGDTHCNNCAPCFMRKTAFERNGLIDPVFV